MRALVPILRIFDVAKAREFYLDYLGFSVEWEHRFEDALPLYFEVSRGDVRLHLSEHHGDSSPGAALRIEIRDLEAFARELQIKDYPYARPQIERTPWGTQELTIIDPFRNRLVFVAAP